MCSEGMRFEVTADAQVVLEAYMTLVHKHRAVEDEVAALKGVDAVYMALTHKHRAVEEDVEELRRNEAAQAAELSRRWEALVAMAHRCKEAEAEVKKLKKEKAADSRENKELAKCWWASAEKYRYIVTF